MVQSMNDDNQLSGVRVLVVEDDALTAMDLKATLVEPGAVVVGLCQTLDEAMARVDADDFCVVVLDFGLGSDTASPVARRLVRRGVPTFSIRETRAANRACSNGETARSSRSRSRRALWCPL
jgi:DNA-binding response OmpR family regulator